jgi:hypothetical protein
MTRTGVGEADGRVRADFLARKQDDVHGVILAGVLIHLDNLDKSGAD